MAEAGTQETAVKTTEKQRPLGTWILTLYALVFAGLMPLVIEIHLVFSAVGRDSEGFSNHRLSHRRTQPGDYHLSIGAWKGDDRARIFFVFFVTLYYILIALNGLLVQFSGDPEAGPININRILMGVLIPPFYMWYFRREDTREFYARTSPED